MSVEVRKIESIIEAEFSVDNYVDLIKEIFSTAKLISPDKQKKEYSNFSSHIVGCSHVADYETPDNKTLVILAVELQKDSYVENSRSTQRNYAKKWIESYNSDAAVVAFYTDGEPKWRLSFVRLDYEMKFENGKLSAVENLTPARRYSFLVGKGESSHTAIEQLHSFIIDNNSQPTLDELEEAFSVEKVTKEFFELYCEKYHKLREYLLTNEDFLAESENCGFTVEQFAKKLMGQIVFLYFLQKKGWMGVGVWPKELTEKEYNNVYYTRGTQGKRIKEYLPWVYQKKGENYVLRSAALDAIPDDAEEMIANNLPRSKTKNWNQGDKDFMRTLFTFYSKPGKNFYDDYLEPLFYDTLNQNRGRMGYSPLFHCRIPFLSGGLFEPIKGYDWRTSKFNIPNELFSNRVGDDKRTGDGILDVFDRYNFTMSEDEPMEREVAIDPEMLGKVFENLLDVTDRKSKGAFYTPREIVHYMCQESLINYLVNETGISEMAIRDLILYGDFMKDEDTVKTMPVDDGNGNRHMQFDYNRELYISEEILSFKNGINRLKDIDDALADIRVADPAVGSGAFPLGMLNEIVRARQCLTEYMIIASSKDAKSDAQAKFLARDLYRYRSAYELKKYAIKNSIYAVDIEPSAVDIARLRLWLSLVIDDEINPEATNIMEGHCDPFPLPNLECNIRCGNSLLDEFEGKKLLNQSDLLDDSYGDAQYNIAQSEFEAVLPDLFKRQDDLFYCDDPKKKVQLMDEIAALKEAAIEPQLRYMPKETRERYEEAKDLASPPFMLWQLEFAKVFKDKGGFDVVIGNPPYIQLQKAISDDSSVKLGDLYEKCGFETFAKTGDIYCLFYEKGYQLLRKKGVLSFITSNKWMRAGYGKALRGFFAKNTNPLVLIDFAGQKVFESATVDVNILICSKESNQNNTAACIAQEDCKNNLSVFVKQNSSQMNFSGNDSWTILSPIEQSIKRKIEAVGVPLKDWDINIYRGILTGYNEAFIISGEKKDELIAKDPRSAEIIRPILRGRDIKRYTYEFADLWIIAMFPSKNYDINDYPAIRDYLLSFGMERLEQSGKSYIINGKTIKSRKKTNNKWFETQDSISYWNDFYMPKIVWGNLCLSAQFAFAENDYFINAPSPMIVPGNKYLLAVLNSKLADWYIRQLGVTRNGGYFEYKPMFIEKLPVPIISQHSQQEYVSIVDQILRSKRLNLDTSELESSIDALVFQLYSLNKDETSYIIGK